MIALCICFLKKESGIKFVTSANIACGWHAGDPVVMDRTVKMAADLGVGVGAHPG
jgi:UPF0271 protein